jgi:hypothetical protein
MGPPEAVLERRRRADAPVNDGSFVRWELYRNLLGRGALHPGGSSMRKQLTIRIYVTIDVSARNGQSVGSSIFILNP